MLDGLLDNLQKRKSIQERLATLNETVSWERIALALYSLTEDAKFRGIVMRHQAKRNRRITEGIQIVGHGEEDYMEFMDEVSKLSSSREVEYDADQLEKALGRPTMRSHEPPGSTWIGNIDGDLFSVVSQDDGTCTLYSNDDDVLDKLIEYIDLELSVGENRVNEGLADYARRELEIAGLFDEDSDYEGMIGEAVMSLVELFASQGHSGCSADITRSIFDRLASYKPLTELTDDPSEWTEIAEEIAVGEKCKLYQSTRSPTCFSRDGGKTYWNIDEIDGCRIPGKEPVHTSVNQKDGNK